MQSRLKLISQSFIDFIYPNKCTLCDKDLVNNEKHVCSSCSYDLPYITSNPEDVTKLNTLFKGRVQVEQVFSLFRYQKGNQVQRLLHAIKYHKKTKMAKHFGEVLGQNNSFPKDIDFIVPVPLHPKKERKRGFNQSLVLANGLSDSLNVPINNSNLMRRIANDSQTKFSKYDRYENVRSIFALKDKSLFENKHILLVDDVLTTGATIESSALELLQTKNCRVSIATLAARV